MATWRRWYRGVSMVRKHVCNNQWICGDTLLYNSVWLYDSLPGLSSSISRPASLVLSSCTALSSCCQISASVSSNKPRSSYFYDSPASISSTLLAFSRAFFPPRWVSLINFGVHAIRVFLLARSRLLPNTADFKFSRVVGWGWCFARGCFCSFYFVHARLDKTQ